MGLALTCIVTAAQLSTPPELITIASGSIFALESLGGSVALATYTAIFNSISSKHLQANVAAAVVLQVLTWITSLRYFNPLNPTTQPLSWMFLQLPLKYLQLAFKVTAKHTSRLLGLAG